MLAGEHIEISWARRTASNTLRSLRWQRPISTTSKTPLIFPALPIWILCRSLLVPRWLASLCRLVSNVRSTVLAIRDWLVTYCDPTIVESLVPSDLIPAIAKIPGHRLTGFHLGSGDCLSSLVVPIERRQTGV